MFWSGFVVGAAVMSLFAHAFIHLIRLIDNVWRTHQYCDRCGAELRHHPR